MHVVLCSLPRLLGLDSKSLNYIGTPTKDKNRHRNSEFSGASVNVISTLDAAFSFCRKTLMVLQWYHVRREDLNVQHAFPLYRFCTWCSAVKHQHCLTASATPALFVLPKPAACGSQKAQVWFAAPRRAILGFWNIQKSFEMRVPCLDINSWDHCFLCLETSLDCFNPDLKSSGIWPSKERNLSKLLPFFPTESNRSLGTMSSNILILQHSEFPNISNGHRP